MIDREMMFDLETLDTTPKAVVISLGAVVWRNIVGEEGVYWTVEESLYRVLEFQSQFDLQGRTVSQSTLLWWMGQSQEARDAAFAPDRTNPGVAGRELNDMAQRHKIAHFWANPSTFDFPIWDDLANLDVPWTYRQKHDVRTAVNEASYSAHAHEGSRSVMRAAKAAGFHEDAAHHPVYDCLWQIDLLTAARNKVGRK